MDQNKIKSTIAQRVNALRCEKNITKKELAEVLGISGPMCSDILTGKRMPFGDLLVRIAGVFDVSVDYIMGFCDVRDPYPFESCQNNLKTLRLDRGITQFELATIMGYRQATCITRVECSSQHSLRIRRLIAASEKFDVPMDFLLDITSQQHRHGRNT